MTASRTPDEIALFRRQLDTILASKTFASTRQLSDFLRFVSEKSLAGVSQLAQEEIAGHVLGKDREFDATYDSAVRKFASMTRQRLARYYAAEGAGDAIELSLPLRSYLPVFRYREPAAILTAARFPWLAAAGALALTLAVALYVIQRQRRETVQAAESIEYTISTAHGDLAYHGADAPPGSVLLGGTLEDGKALIAMLSFRPEHEAQQAGILLWTDGDNYVRLGRSFTGRNYIEFAAERNGAVQTRPDHLIFDPEGQSGVPVWLSVQRNGTQYQAFISPDGLEWRAIGSALDVPEIGAPRIGIYAYHGRREVPAAEANFRYVSQGLLFTDRSLDRLRTALKATCESELQAAEKPPLLLVNLLATAPACSAVLPVSRLGDRDWTIETRIDAIAIPGAMAGMYLAGSRGRVRIIRYGTDQTSISLMHDLKSVQNLPDYNGAPPLTLRLEKKGTLVFGSSSRDGRSYRAFPNAIPLTELGPELNAGLILAISGKGKPHVSPSMGVYHWRDAAERLRPYR